MTESGDIAEKRRALSEQKNRLLQIRELLLDVSVEDVEVEEELNNGTLSIPAPDSPASLLASPAYSLCSELSA